MATLQAEADQASGTRSHSGQVLRRPAPPMDAGFILMQDPEGNEFCLD